MEKSQRGKWWPSRKMKAYEWGVIGKNLLGYWNHDYCNQSGNYGTNTFVIQDTKVSEQIRTPGLKGALEVIEKEMKDWHYNRLTGGQKIKFHKIETQDRNYCKIWHKIKSHFLHKVKTITKFNIRSKLFLKDS